MNINQTVRVRFTEIGKTTCKPIETLGTAEDEQGYYSMPLWELMQVLGPHLFMGMGGTLIENNNIEIVKDIMTC